MFTACGGLTKEVGWRSITGCRYDIKAELQGLVACEPFGERQQAAALTCL